MLPQLVEMFGIHGEYSPDWDRERKYRANDLQLYVDMPSANGREVVEAVRPDLPLIEQLLSKQRRGYGIPGIPTLHVLVRGSDYEMRFFLNRLHTP